MRTARPCSPTASVRGLPTSRIIRSTISCLAASTAAAAALSASARASAERDHSRAASRAFANAPATTSRSAAGALTITSDGSWGERLSIVAVLMHRTLPRLRRGERVDVGGRQAVAADRPVPALDLLDDAPGDLAQRLALDLHHGVGQALGDLALLVGREHALDELHVDEWHAR